MKKNKFFKDVIRSFHDNKMLFSMCFLGLSSGLTLMGNKLGLFYLILALLTSLLLGILFIEERKIYN